VRLNKVIRVVLVDDSPAFLKAACTFVRARLGMEVLGTAATGLEGIAAVESLHPDVVLMDFEMPGMTGLEAARAIKSADATVRVVMVSLHDQAIQRQMGDVSHIDGFINKTTFSEACPLLMATLFGAQAGAAGAGKGLQR
jgi:DNA-binding NarL/FixJ family response regulator